MVVLDVCSKNIIISYKSTVFAKATFVVITLGVIAIVLPFIFAYKSRGLWLKRDVFYEQPDIKFTGKYLFVATTSSEKLPVLACSSLPHFNNKLSSLDYCASIKFREIDHDFDGKNDEFILNLQIRHPKGVQLSFFNLILEFNYKLKWCELEMKTGIIQQQLLPPITSSFLLIADVILTQKTPIICHKKLASKLIHNTPIIPDDHTIDNYEVAKIIDNYSERNISTKLSNLYTSFTSDKSSQFSLDVKLRYPESHVYYKPGFWQTMKWAWIQYLAIYTLTAWLIAIIKAYIFSKRFVLFYEDNPLKKKQIK